MSLKEFVDSTKWLATFFVLIILLIYGLYIMYEFIAVFVHNQHTFWEYQGNPYYMDLETGQWIRPTPTPDTLLNHLVPPIGDIPWNQCT